uniref:Uncharacterized protein n=1 Tax=Rhizophora mucronata TaxID=61149 RepID=A0A2P2P2R3_RHIMU
MVIHKGKKTPRSQPHETENPRIDRNSKQKTIHCPARRI